MGKSRTLRKRLRDIYGEVPTQASIKQIDPRILLATARYRVREVFKSADSVHYSTASHSVDRIMINEKGIFTALAVIESKNGSDELDLWLEACSNPLIQDYHRMMIKYDALDYASPEDGAVLGKLVDLTSCDMESWLSPV